MALGRKTGGRRKGSTNKLDSAGKAVLKVIVDRRLKDLDEIIEDTWRGIEIEKTVTGPDGKPITILGRLNADPARAGKLILEAAEYIYPKLGRLEHTGDGGGPVEFVIRDIGREG